MYTKNKRKTKKNEKHLANSPRSITEDWQYLLPKRKLVITMQIKMLIKSNKGYYCIPPLWNSINDQNIDDIAYDDSDKCELLNKYFSSISKLDEENVTLPQFDSKTNNIIHEIHITENEIIDVIQILDPNKATGPDKISNKRLTMSPEKITKPLLIIFNKSLQQSKYPSNWKSAHVIAIFKKGDTSIPSNYRSISLICCVGKLLERIVYKHVYNHLVNNNLIYKYQSGILPKHSTVHQLLELYNSILKVFYYDKFLYLSCPYGTVSSLFPLQSIVHSFNANTKGCNKKLQTNTDRLSIHIKFVSSCHLSRSLFTSFCIPLPLKNMRTYKVSLSII